MPRAHGTDGATGETIWKDQGEQRGGWHTTAEAAENRIKVQVDASTGTLAHGRKLVPCHDASRIAWMRDDDAKEAENRRSWQKLDSLGLQYSGGRRVTLQGPLLTGAEMQRLR